MSPREEVYGAIDTERAYQQSKWGDRPHSLTEWLAYMTDYVEEAQHMLCREYNETASVPKALHIVRKVAAMGVAAMEQHGALRRNLEQGVGAL